MWVGDELGEAPSSVAKQIWDETGTHGYEMWSRAGREITAMFTREGDRLQAINAFSPPSLRSTCMRSPVRPSTSRYRRHSLGTILGSLYAIWKR
jgi:hypothetical protein